MNRRTIIDRLEDEYGIKPENLTEREKAIIGLCTNELLENEEQALSITNFINPLKFKLEVNAGRLAESLSKEGKQPKEDENCHKAFLMLAHLEAIEDYINGQQLNY